MRVCSQPRTQNGRSFMRWRSGATGITSTFQAVFLVSTLSLWAKTQRESQRLRSAAPCVIVNRMKRETEISRGFRGLHGFKSAQSAANSPSLAYRSWQETLFGSVFLQAIPSVTPPDSREHAVLRALMRASSASFPDARRQSVFPRNSTQTSQLTRLPDIER
jgi:hypothetical protein